MHRCNFDQSNIDLPVNNRIVMAFSFRRRHSTEVFAFHLVLGYKLFNEGPDYANEFLKKDNWKKL